MAFTRGPHTLAISAKLFAENRARLVDALKSKVMRGSVVLLQGGADKCRYNTDSEDLPFRQESYFFWAFGVHEDGFFGAIDVDSGKSILFPPRLHPDFAIWHGRIDPESWFEEKYGVDEAHFSDDGVIANVLTKFNAKQLLLLRASNTDSKEVLQPANFAEKSEFLIDANTLYPIIADLRVFKTDSELEVIRYACKVCCEGHKAAMKVAKPGIYEYQLESTLRHSCYFNGGCRYMAYTSIAATGANTAVLHYGHAGSPNECLAKDGDLVLLDMGPEYNCYASDITTTFPCNGKFTAQQKLIYNVVLHANREVFKAMKPGVRWTDMHQLAERTILSDLVAGGLLKGDVNEMMNQYLGAVFMPHGLGHFMGLDVHDVGGYLGDALLRPIVPGLKCLRTTRTLQERMVITIEPGCYFIDPLLDAALENSDQAKFINEEKLKEFRGFGGVRIEDDVVVWAKGAELLTPGLPRTVEEIEAFMAE